MGGALHILAALAIVLSITFWHWFAIPFFFVLGFFWEKTQHRRIITRHHYLSRQAGHPVYMIEDETFFGWITPHRLWEAAGWGLGGTLAAVIIELLTRWEMQV